MTLWVDLYRTDDYVPAGRIELLSLLVPVFEAELGQPLRDARLVLRFHAIADPRELTGQPHVTNLRNSHGYLTVQIIRHGEGVIYQHGFPVREIIGRTLQRKFAQENPAERHWGFGLSGTGLEGISLERPAPRPADAVSVEMARPPRGVLHLEEMAEPEPPAVSLASLGVAAGATAPGPAGQPLVVFAGPVHAALTERMVLSDEVEEGGFLLGRLLRDEASGQPVVHVTGAPRAERTGASLLDFTFTGDSFARVNQVIAQAGDGHRLVGWYHTHLFAATADVGLSTVDVRLHTGTFRQAWHVAALLNLDHHGGRVLRAYAWDGTAMRELSFLVSAS